MGFMEKIFGDLNTKEVKKIENKKLKINKNKIEKNRKLKIIHNWYSNCGLFFKF